jgi:hypothetical protein
LPDKSLEKQYLTFDLKSDKVIAFRPFCLLAFFNTFGLNSKNPTSGSIGRLLLSNSMCPLAQE